MLDKVDALFARLEDVMAFQAIRQGLILTIPVLLVGSFCLIFLNLPLAPYQDALAGAPRVEGLLDLVYDGTMGIFSLYVSVAVALRYANACAERFGGFFVQGAPFAALAAYLMSVGFGTEGFDPIVLSTRSLFIAIVCGLASSVLYCRLVRLRRTRRLYGDSLDNVFNQAVSGLLPIAAVIALFGAANAAVAALSGSSCIEQLFFDSVSALFPLATATLGSGLLYLFLNNVMWFFGIHGGNMLDGVAQSVFVPGTAANAAALAAGGEPVQIVTKTFLDVFASIGGAGALLSLLAAILLFGRRTSARRLSAFAAVPMCFNISEIMLFGLPVVWNPALFAPFIAVPLVNMVVSYAAMAAGLVPPVVVDVSWTTPPLVGGWVATGSPAGAVLQLACIALGTVLYLPFLRRYERLADAHARVQYDALLSSFQDDERAGRSVELVTAAGSLGAVARSLAEDVRAAVDAGAFELRYQPQFDADGRAVGAEALLRMEHPVYGWLYPPLVIELAREAGAGGELERAVFERALADAQAAEALAHAGELDAGFSVSVNATATMLQDEEAVGFVIDAFRARGLDAGRVVVEATEREALLWDAGAHDLLRRVADAGMPLAIDDFSMGRTSFQYLETSVFSVVKLDGTIAKGVMENERYAEIVSSIADLSEHLGFTVLAEYVETAEQRDVLKTLGCSYFQGYLYAPALPFDEMVERARLTGTLR
ncbi:PTS sugar transporter subunit IIC/EAL domain-containing protein [Gordonibacter urolithinfaciens]|mgnify:FL=1|uniref:EAL domain-containing protein n=2 Tax=Gordonibacter urolithinfaciens TaxID=1335613 RepID=A0A6N8IKL5_9ACTN|nr:EAL domain-containing protein [Gordonibacter urolithinfaciens]MVM55767.1 EAL domain-containing protein [Gordonibacter urolithinfaciens]MVN16272.1 EAL domain-containing protein [Gordonibacter urolithinfaciens]MVN39600.1 EAL domain-containing protein [Gordonibacter urolithinfaciens]MVN57061.1 EAL domain-containing protein [Gordonibacter urolithinfaciens]MVN62201.1 EAL domain-containing protein [Gordonibacter urolithinfaciens]